MSAVFQKIKSINQWERDLVTGYTKEAQRLLVSMQIPMAISYVCLTYFHEYDYFIKCGKRAKINKDKDCVTIKTLSGGTTYGNIIIDDSIKMIYSWKFKISGKIARDAFYYIAIGIDSSNRSYYDGFFPLYGNAWRQFEFYAFLYDGKKVSSKENKKRYGTNFKQGDTVTMEINVQKQEMKYFVNDKDQGIAFKNIDFKQTKYNMAVFAGDKGVEIKLIEFKRYI